MEGLAQRIIRGDVPESVKRDESLRWTKVHLLLVQNREVVLRST